MRNISILLVSLTITIQVAIAQSRDVRKLIPVYIDSRGVKDETGSRFVFALKRVLSNSQVHDLGAADVDDRRLQFFLELVTIDLVPIAKASKMSVASVAIEEMYLPNSYPVATMWYHKVFLLNDSKLDELARQFVADMDAHWCNHIKSSVGNCPKESIPPTYP
jgi:hypothetical protein